jgi:hypothetical protein
VIHILDERGNWFQPLINAAKSRGMEAKRIFTGGVIGEGYGFFRPHAHPATLKRNQLVDYPAMIDKLIMIQDKTQADLYEDKTGQFERWGKWMPNTRIITSKEEALSFAEMQDFPIISKANEGASSKNVRIIACYDDLVSHINRVFGAGETIYHCDSKGTTSKQVGYIYLQEFVSHDTTYRVNAIGNGRAIFKRYNYPDKQVAQTGNVEPVLVLDEKMESLLEFADAFFTEAETKWCALDVLETPQGWKLLETSLAWPWPSPGACSQATIFRTKHKWVDMWEVLLDEIEEGTWG